MSEQVDIQIRTFRVLLNDHSEHTAIEWLREVLLKAERESTERQRLAHCNHDLRHQFIALSDEIAGMARLFTREALRQERIDDE